jgi:hypothetical protein
MKNEGKKGRRGGTWHIATIHLTSHMYNAVHVLLLECSFLAMYVRSLSFMPAYMTQLLTLYSVFCECW